MAIFKNTVVGFRGYAKSIIPTSIHIFILEKYSMRNRNVEKRWKFEISKLTQVGSVYSTLENHGHISSIYQILKDI